MPSPRKALEAFADAEQNPDLLQLERLLYRFNLFEAVGVVRHELRHSDFLAYLLNPSQYHGLGAVFLKELLQAVLLTTEGDSAVPASDLDVWDLSQAVVQREWHHIDILVVDDVNRFAVLIENKVDTGEHSNQLNRYHAEFRSHYPGYKVVALFLTPDGNPPSSDAYHAVSYTLVCEGIEKVIRDRRSVLDGEVVMLLEHYAQMLRRHIVSDSDVAELCRSIYQKHRQALDLIFEHRPDQQALVKEYVKSLVLKQHGMKFYADGKWYVNFSLQEWDNALKFRDVPTNAAIFPYLAFVNRPDSLTVSVWIGPGTPDDRQKMLQLAKEHFLAGVTNKLKGREWSQVTSFNVLSAKDYEKTQDEIEAIISEKWAEYLRDELPRIVKAVRDEKWLWETPH